MSKADANLQLLNPAEQERHLQKQKKKCRLQGREDSSFILICQLAYQFDLLSFVFCKLGNQYFLHCRLFFLLDSSKATKLQGFFSSIRILLIMSKKRTLLLIRWKRTTQWYTNHLVTESGVGRLDYVL